MRNMFRLGQMLCIYLLYTLITTSLCCQDPWTIESPMIKLGSRINFKNSSSVGQGESLTWSWIGLNGGVWENQLWYSNVEGKMGGGFIFKRHTKHKKGGVSVTWFTGDNGEIVWDHDSEMVKQPPWKISVKGLVDVEFIPLERDWIFRVGEDKLYGTGLQQSEQEQSVESRDEMEEGEREKRSPQFESGTTGEECSSSGSWFDKIVNFFFGEGTASALRGIGAHFEREVAGTERPFPRRSGRRGNRHRTESMSKQCGIGGSGRGESDGIFDRLGKWLRGISCSLHGPCDQPVPSDPPAGPFPPPPITTPATPVTVPQPNPDAETLPAENDV